jgi:hypothetical protein
MRMKAKNLIFMAGSAIGFNGLHMIALRFS